MAERTDGVNSEETARVLQEVAARSSHILQEFGQKRLEQSISSAVKDELGIARAYMDLYSHVLMDPSAFAAAGFFPRVVVGSGLPPSAQTSRSIISFSTLGA